jgi:hypothetical protein
MTDASDEQRWYQRRKFWFTSGILADRRTGIDRREPAHGDASADDRRLHPPRRIASERRLGERRLGERRSAE